VVKLFTFISLLLEEYFCATAERPGDVFASGGARIVKENLACSFAWRSRRLRKSDIETQKKRAVSGAF